KFQERDLLDGGGGFCLLVDMSSSPLSSFLTLWYKPGQTLQGLIAAGKGGAGAIAISGLFGLVQAWPTYAAEGGGNVAILGIGFGAAVAGLFLFSWLLRNFGRWFGGEPKLEEVRVALGWGLLPWAVLFGLLLGFIANMGGDPREMFPFFFAVIIYGFIVLLHALSEGLGLPLMKTFFCLIITVVVSIFPITLLLQAIVGVPGAAGP
ncbi:MAG: YIP1 family protein, partial [Opitutales bacterium]